MNRELQNFLLQSQRSAALLMGFFCVLLVIIQSVLVGSLFLFEDTGQNLNAFPFLCLPLVTAVLAWLEFFNARRVKRCIDHGNGTLGFSRYMSAIGEALLPTFGILVIMTATNWGTAISSPPLLGYFVIIIISMLRMESNITLLIGTIESLTYLVLVFVFITSRQEVNSFAELEIRLILGRVIVILLATVIAAFIVKKMRTLLNELISSHEAQTLTMQKLMATNAEKARAEKVIWQKDQLLSILGHDLRTPLNGVSGLSELMANAPEKFSTEEIRRYATEIHGTSQNLSTLLDNLLAWAQCRTGQIEVTPRDYTIQALVDPVIQIFTTAASTKAITISIEVDNTKRIRTDRKLAQTILRNLLSNAIKFTPNEGTIRITSNENSTSLSLQIVDSGNGIAETVLENLANKRLSRSSPGTKQEQGTGLGLLLCLDLAKRVGIKLEFSIDAGGGTNAEIIFPKKI